MSVAIVLSEQRVAYQEFAAELSRMLPANYAIRVLDLGESPATGDVVVPVGMKAAALFASHEQPILNVFVPHSGFESMRRAASATYSAVFMDQPMSRHLALISAALPHADMIGVVYSSPSNELKMLKRAVAENGFGLREQLVGPEYPLIDALSDILPDSDVLLVLPDSEVYRSDTIRNILLETYRVQVPVIGISQNYVAAGALCAIYSTPKQFAQQTADVLQQFELSGRLSAPRYAKEFEVAVNPQVARSLGINIRDAIQLRQEVRRRE